VDTIEDEVFVIRDADTRPFFKSMGHARNTSTALLRLLGGKADVLRRLTKRCDEPSTTAITTLRKDIGMNLDDVQDHVSTMTANLSHFETILGRAHSNYLATLRINKLSQDIKTNRFLGKITLVAGVCIPLQLIGSLWGMNVLVPMKDVHSLGPFFGIAAFIAIVSILMLGYAKWKKFV
jgi:magnesium transporter